MARKAGRVAPKKFKGSESFIPLEEQEEANDSEAEEFQAMGLPKVASDDEMSEGGTDDDDPDSEDDGSDASLDDRGDMDGGEEDDEDVDDDDGDDDDEDGDDDDDDDDDEDEDPGTRKGNAASWGTKLKNYYDEGSEEYSDDEDIDDRIAEAERIAKELYDDVEDDDAELDEIEDEESTEFDDSSTALDSLLGDLSSSLRNQSATMELPPNFAEMNESEKMEYVENEHPEFLLLLKEFKDKSVLMNDQILKIVNDKDTFKMCTKDGMEYLELRNELMLMYVSYLSYYLLLKSHGISVENHTVIDRLLEIRIMLDKAKPIESRLQFEINKLIDEKESKDVSKELRPRLHLMEIEERNAGDSYVTPQHLDMVETDSYAKHQKKLMRKERVVSGRKMLDEMEEHDSDSGEDRIAQSKASKMMKALIEREKYEMENMKRLPMTKMAKKELRLFNKKHINKQAGYTLDDISGLASDVLNVADTKRKNLLSGFNAAAQTLRQDILETEKLKTSDASYKPPSRRKERMHDTVSAPAPRPKKAEFDDEFSKMKKQQVDLVDQYKKSKDESKKRKFERTLVDGKREASSDIIRNKGLTRKRSKTAGNARVANRMKYEKKQVSFKSKTGGEKSETPGYSGESTGINSKKKKSVTF